MKSLATLLSDPEPCSYLPGQVRRMSCEFVVQITPAEYLERLNEGWRRFGPTLFRHACPSCQRCQSIRIPVAGFRSNESQRRAWRLNAGALTVTAGEPGFSEEKAALYTRYHAFQSESKGWPGVESDGIATFLRNPLPTEEWQYRLDDRLVAVGYVDVLPDSLSAIYFFYDPDQRHRSLGTFNVLALIASAMQRGLAHVHLGYYVEGCRSLEYKARFTPNEILVDRNWAPFRR